MTPRRWSTGGGSFNSREAQHGHDRHRDEQRHRQREHHDDRQLLEENARHAGEEEQRHEHRDMGQRRGQDRQPYFLAAVDCRLHPVLTVLHVPGGVLEHDDGGVDDHADAEGEAAEVIVLSV